MITIWKYAIEPEARTVLKIPRMAQLLTVQAQGDGPAAIWFRVDTNMAPVDRAFRVFGTGHELPAPDSKTWLKYCGTFQLLQGTLVFHIFEELPDTGDLTL